MRGWWFARGAGGCLGELKEEAGAVANWSVGERRAEGEGDLMRRKRMGKTRERGLDKT